MVRFERRRNGQPMLSVTPPMSTPRKRAFALVLLAAIGIASCGSPSADLEPGQAVAALDGEFATVEGATIDLAELRGEDVVLWFWAPW